MRAIVDPGGYCLRSSLTNLNINTSAVFQSKTVRRLVTRQYLLVEAELEVLLTQALAFSEYGENNTECASVSQAKVRLFSRVRITEKDGDRVVSGG